MYEIFEHTADLGLRVRADDLPALFAEAARGLFAMIAGDLATIRPAEELRFAVPGDVTDELLHDWLAELLFTFHTRRVLLCDFDVSLAPNGLTATARGEPIDPVRHEIDVELKAVTYHGLKVVQEDTGWLAEVIVDT
jgi:SHS2 domain-containing protein